MEFTTSSLVTLSQNEVNGDIHRVNWKVMIGSSQAPLATRVCHSGAAPDDAMVCHARPRRPDTGLVRSPEETVSQTAVEENQQTVLRVSGSVYAPKT